MHTMSALSLLILLCEAALVSAGIDTPTAQFGQPNEAEGQYDPLFNPPITGYSGDPTSMFAFDGNMFDTPNDGFAYTLLDAPALQYGNEDQYLFDLMVIHRHPLDFIDF